MERTSRIGESHFRFTGCGKRSEYTIRETRFDVVRHRVSRLKDRHCFIKKRRAAILCERDFCARSARIFGLFCFRNDSRRRPPTGSSFSRSWPRMRARVPRRRCRERIVATNCRDYRPVKFKENTPVLLCRSYIFGASERFPRNWREKGAKRSWMKSFFNRARKGDCTTFVQRWISFGLWSKL